MKPDKVVCQNCGKQISKGKWCSDKCRKAFARADNPDTEPGQTRTNVRLNPDKTNPDTQVGQNPDTFRESLTKTDKTFYDRAMKDFGEPYYRFSGDIRDRVCNQCGSKFQTSLSLNRYCSYVHYHGSLGGRHT